MKQDACGLPLPDAERLYFLLKENDDTSGTSEQKALVLRRRFDQILRMSLGGFGSESNFYAESLNKVLEQMKATKEEAKEMNQMRQTFNLIMHSDVKVDEKRYRLILGRMASFVSLVTARPIPEDIQMILPSFAKQAGPRQGVTAVPIVCCIDASSIPDEESRDSFNRAAFQFRQSVLSDARMRGRIDFKFIVAREDSVSIRDMGDGAPVEYKSSRPKEEAVFYAEKEILGKPSGFLMLLFGGKALGMTSEENRRFVRLRQSVILYPIALPGADDHVFGNLEIGQDAIKMREDCFDEFFSWLFDSILILYIK